MCLFTGARRLNVQAMRWKEVSFEEATWRIPDTKSGEPQVVPLDPWSIEILKERRKSGTVEEFVFPGRGKRGHIMEIRYALSRVCKAADIEDLRPHDLRRTLGSFQAIQGTSMIIIGESLGQTSQQATAVYSRIDTEPVRASKEAAVALMVDISNGDQGGEVRAIRDTPD